MEDSYFYVFKRPVEFYRLPSQERVDSVWRIPSSDSDALLSALSPPPEAPSQSRQREGLKPSDPDIRHDARMRQWDGYCKLYVHVKALTAADLEDDSIDWFSKHAWFDEFVKVIRYHNVNDGF
ncbi:hypothetical protein OPQ81_003267 [Rhizoctonia solani]|nr:hypothetical protein OPQ81_003267 [Rhizoctonia solani]